MIQIKCDKASKETGVRKGVFFYAHANGANEHSVGLIIAGGWVGGEDALLLTAFIFS